MEHQHPSTLVPSEPTLRASGEGDRLKLPMPVKLRNGKDMQDSENVNEKRRRLYGRRQTRPLKLVHRSALEEFLPSLKIDLPELSSCDSPLSPRDFFQVPYEELCLEVGFGGGEHLFTQASQAPHQGFIGCEPYLNGVASFLKLFTSHPLQNVRLFMDDALTLLKQFEPSSLSRIFILFPDPWPKKRHYKRRFIQKDSLEILARTLKLGGLLIIATDHADYREWILQHLQECPSFKALRPLQEIFEKPANWPSTRYETKALAENRPPAYIVYEKI